MSNSIRDAFLSLSSKGNEKAYTLLVTAKSSKQIAAEKAKADYADRVMELKGLIELARIPTQAAPGCTSRAERVAKELSFLGGEDYQEALSVLRYARVSKTDWETALACFGPQTVSV